MTKDDWIALSDEQRGRIARKWSPYDTRSSLSEPVPDDFDVFAGYVWAPENYANFVDKHVAEVRSALGNREMTREQMLHALIGVPFEEWVEQCRRFGPGYTDL